MHEQTLSIGLATRILARVATRILLSHEASPHARRHPRHLRHAIASLLANPAAARTWPRPPPPTGRLGAADQVVTEILTAAAGTR